MYFKNPIDGYITSTYGNRINPVLKKEEFHNGVDIYGELGQDVFAIADGVVTEVRKSETYGNILKYKLKDFEEFEVFYAHLNLVEVKEGDVIEKGQVVATCGNTGLTTGPHLHFTIYKNGVHLDPINLLDMKITNEALSEVESRRKNE